ncbi:MAG: hypothetical protein ACFE9L_08635 [Candidatus Hodarchaeota archaeon]
MVNKGSKIPKGSKTKSGGSYQSKNVDIGIQAEQRVLYSIPDEYEPERVTKDKTSPDGGIPDIRIYSANNQRLIEVKSISKDIADGHGRAQFKRKEIRDLAEYDGLVLFEVRCGKSKRYYKTEAEEVWDLLKDERGNELKLEYSQIISFEEVDPDDPSIWLE